MDQIRHSLHNLLFVISLTLNQKCRLKLAIFHFASKAIVLANNKNHHAGNIPLIVYCCDIFRRDKYLSLSSERVELHSKHDCHEMIFFQPARPQNCSRLHYRDAKLPGFSSFGCCFENIVFK